MSKIDPRVLKEFATTERHHEVLDVVIQEGSANKASKVLGCSRRVIDKMLRRLEATAASQGVAPHRDLTHQTAEGFEAKRISTAYKEDGSQALQWVIQEKAKGLNKDKIVEAIEGFEWKPAPKIKAAKGHDSELLTLYTDGRLATPIPALSAQFPNKQQDEDDERRNPQRN